MAASIADMIVFNIIMVVVSVRFARTMNIVLMIVTKGASQTASASWACSRGVWAACLCLAATTNLILPTSSSSGPHTSYTSQFYTPALTLLAPTRERMWPLTLCSYGHEACTTAPHN